MRNEAGETGSHETLAGFARAIVASADLDAKVALSRRAADLWQSRSLSLSKGVSEPRPPSTPGRPARPELRPPRDMPKRSQNAREGRIALIHALAHVELNAVDLSWDIIGRFHTADVPTAFFDDWVRVGSDEARHFSMLRQLLLDNGSSYGALPAHDGLWQAADETRHDLVARVAIVPLVLEARGLDVAPAMIDKAESNGDDELAGALRVIYEDEKGHVAVGARWFRHLCGRRGVAPEPMFHRLVRTHFKGRLKPPFNDRARSEAGLTPGFYKPLVPVCG